MKIAIPIFSFTRSGGARVLAEMASEWVRHGHEVEFLCATRGSKPYFPTLAKIQYGSCEVSSGLATQFFELRRLIHQRAGKVDAILANFHLTAWAVWAAGAAARQQATYYMQAYEVGFYDEHPKWLQRSVLKLLARGSLRLLPRVVVNAPIYFDYPGVRAVEWVPPGLDFTRFRARQTAFAPTPGHPLAIGCIGRHERWKGTWDVVAATNILLERGLDIRLRIAYHSPPSMPDRVAAVVETIVPGNDAELGEFYRGCDILIAPATMQLGAPHYPVMEAMACNVPVITTGYLPANPDNALIVPINQPEAIADAVEFALGNPTATQARAANAQTAIADFSWPMVASKLLSTLAASQAVGDGRPK